MAAAGAEPLGDASAGTTAALLFGPTACGKTALAVELSARLPIEVISADSRQVYRRLDVGTAKPAAAERAAVPHHLIDCIELDDTYNAARFAAEAHRLVAEIRGRGRIPVVVGGAGFYLHVLRQGLFAAPFPVEVLHHVRDTLAAWSTDALRRELDQRDPQRAAAIHPNDRYRLSRALEICIAAGTSVTALTAAAPPAAHRFAEFRLQIERAELHQRIAARCTSMLDSGWIEEVERLLAAGHGPELPGLRALGYPHVVAHVRGRIDRTELEARIVRDTRRFARHQETWFRKARSARPLTAGEVGNADRLAALLQPLLPAGAPDSGI
jgi:tRNA dimethylallyltransferase